MKRPLYLALAGLILCAVTWWLLHGGIDTLRKRLARGQIVDTVQGCHNIGEHVMIYGAKDQQFLWGILFPYNTCTSLSFTEVPRPKHTFELAGGVTLEFLKNRVTLRKAGQEAVIALRPHRIYLIQEDLTYDTSADLSGIVFVPKLVWDRWVRHDYVLSYRLDVPEDITERFPAFPRKEEGASGRWTDSRSEPPPFERNGYETNTYQFCSPVGIKARITFVTDGVETNILFCSDHPAPILRVAHLFKTDAYERDGQKYNQFSVVTEHGDFTVTNSAEFPSYGKGGNALHKRSWQPDRRVTPGAPTNWMSLFDYFHSEPKSRPAKIYILYEAAALTNAPVE